MPDDDWVERLNSTDSSMREDASTELRAALIRNLRAQFLKRGLTQDCVEDVVQESVFRILDRLHTFRGDSRFMSWATAVGVRTGMELVRKQYWKTQTLGDLVKGDDLDLSGPWESAELDPKDNSLRAEVLTVLADVMRTALSERQRLVLLGEMKGMPGSEIAEEIGANRGAVYKMTHDARKKIKAELENRGFDADAIQQVLSSGH